MSPLQRFAIGISLVAAACVDKPESASHADDEHDRGGNVAAAADGAAPDAGLDSGAGAGRDAGGAAQADGSSAEHDAGEREAGGATGAADAEQPTCRAFAIPSGADCSVPSDGALPRDLRCTGLYGDFEQRVLACGVLEYAPALELWSDGAQKRRFVWLPEGQRVNTRNPDNFLFPDGTKFWKEFRVVAQDGKMRMAETRLLERRDGEWLYTSYVWSEDETRALQMDNAAGVRDLYGTGHTVPIRDHCKDCHQGRSDYVLGWDALMLGPGAKGVTRDNLVQLGLTDDASALALTIPGNDVERAALGYLHVNCGISCHNQSPAASANESGLYLKLEAAELGSVFMTDAVRSGMNKPAAQNAKLEGLPRAPDDYVDIRPRNPDTSLLVARQRLRGYEGQMPRVATNVIDDAGVQLTTRWIESMTREAGYPMAAPLP